MSMHKKPLTDIEREGLKQHGLPIGTPSQLSDSFRLGIAWALAQHGEPQGWKLVPVEPTQEMLAKSWIAVAGNLNRVEQREFYSAMLAAAPAAPAPVEQRCTYCDGTGDVHGIDGEWRGTCPCAAAPVAQRITVTEDMHVAAVKVLQRANGLDGLPQRMLDAMLAAAPSPVAQQPVAWMHEFDDGELIPKLRPIDDRLNDQPKSVRPLIYAGAAPAQQPHDATLINEGTKSSTAPLAQLDEQHLSTIQWRNIKKVVRAAADLSFGGPSHKEYGHCWIAIVNTLTEKDGIDIQALGLEPLYTAAPEPQPGQEDQNESLDTHFRKRIDVYANKHPTLLVRQLASRLKDAWAQPVSTRPNRSEFESLLGEYWDIAHSEGDTGVPRSAEANEVLHKLRALVRPVSQLSLSAQKVQVKPEFQTKVDAMTDAAVARKAAVKESLTPESAQPVAPHECKTEAEKLAYAAGWWKALESVHIAAHQSPHTSKEHHTEWKLVPIEPTPEMTTASEQLVPAMNKAVYKAMVAAAPVAQNTDKPSKRQYDTALRQWEQWKSYAIELQAKLTKYEGGAQMILNSPTSQKQEPWLNHRGEWTTDSRVRTGHETKEKALASTPQPVQAIDKDQTGEVND
jgi:hypothetical protein